MSKKKTSSKQNKPNTQKPAGKPAKESAAKEKNSSESKKELPQSKKETAPKSAATQTQQAKEKKPEADLPKAGKDGALNKGKAESSAAPESSKAESQAAKSEPSASSSKATASQPKETGKTAATQQSTSKKKDDSKPSAKTQRAGKAKKDKAPRQSNDAEPSESVKAVEATSESGLPLSGEHSQSVAEAPAENEIRPAVSEATDTASADEQKRKVAKTLIDEDVDRSAKNAPPVDSPGDKPRTVAKTMLEVNLGGLKDAVAKATGNAPKAEETPRKVPKTLMEINTDSLRDAVEASSRAIEDEIAAAIKESEASADGLRDSVEASSLAIEDEIAAAIKDSEAAQKNAAQSAEPQEPTAGSPKSADRKIAKTMLDFRAEEFFELANSTTDTLDESSEAPAGEFNADPAANQPPPSQASTQPRKVAKTMLEVDISNINAIVEAASSASQADTEASSQPNIHEPPRDLSAGYDDVSVEDLNEFAQALRDDTAMSPPGSRAERLRKTLMGIRKHGLSSSPSMPGINIPAGAEQADLAAEQKPVRVSRSLHPLDNFSFDNLCPADDDASEAQAESMPPEHDVLADSAPSIGEQSPTSSDWDTSADQGAQEKKNTGTVELDHNPHDGAAESEFKGVTTVWPHDEEKKQQEAQAAEAKQGSVKPERFIPKTMLDMDFLKESLSASVVRAEERLAESIAQKAAEPPKQLLTADDYKIASPNCPFVWSDNPDNPKERVKYCTNCSAQIYNLTGFDMGESQSLIYKRENRNNAPLYKREDGKFMTSDCPIALKKKKDKQMLIGGAALVLILLVIMVIASFMLPQSQPTANPSADTSSANPTVTGDTNPGTSGTLNSKTSSDSSAGSSDSPSSKAAPGAYHYVRGKGVVQSEPVVVPPPSPDPTTLPGTTSGYDEGGSFWQYNDKGNN